MQRNAVRRVAPVIALMFTTAMAANAGLGEPPFAETSADGKHLVIPSEHADQGTVYHTLTQRDRQIYFESNAPLENIKGQSNRVIGYAVAGDDGALAIGEWHLPVESIRTGIDLRDEHLAGGDWLDAKKHPNIVFQLEETRDLKLTKEATGFKTYTATLVGEFTIHGVTQPVTIEDASISYMTESDRTQKIAPGDLMAIRAKYEVKLSDFGVTNSVIGDKVANNIKIDTVLYFSNQK